MPSCTVAVAGKGPDAKGFEKCWKGEAHGEKEEAGEKTLPHAAGGFELNMKALPKEFEAMAAAAEDAVNAANGFEAAEKGPDAKGFEKCWKGAVDGERKVAAVGVVRGFWQVNKFDRADSIAGEEDDGAGLTPVSAAAAVHAEVDRATRFASQFVTSITVGAEEQCEEWSAVSWGCG